MLQLNIWNRLPKFIRYRHDLLQLPKKWLEKKDQGFRPEEWDRNGFLCLCPDHVDDFEQEGDVATSVMGYYICDAYGCGSIAKHELYPGLEDSLKKASEELATGDNE